MTARGPRRLATTHYICAKYGDRTTRRNGQLIALAFYLNYDLHDNAKSTQTLPSHLRDYSTRGVLHPALARVRGADLVVRRQKGKLDVGSALACPEEAAYTWLSSEVNPTQATSRGVESLTSFTGSDFLAHRFQITPLSMVRAGFGFRQFRGTSSSARSVLSLAIETSRRSPSQHTGSTRTKGSLLKPLVHQGRRSFISSTAEDMSSKPRIQMVLSAEF